MSTTLAAAAPMRTATCGVTPAAWAASVPGCGANTRPTRDTTASSSRPSTGNSHRTGESVLFVGARGAGGGPALVTRRKCGTCRPGDVGAMTSTPAGLSPAAPSAFAISRWARSVDTEVDRMVVIIWPDSERRFVPHTSTSRSPSASGVRHTVIGGSWSRPSGRGRRTRPCCVVNSPSRQANTAASPARATKATRPRTAATAEAALTWFSANTSRL